jgi:hypothetical protein
MASVLAQQLESQQVIVQDPYEHRHEHWKANQPVGIQHVAIVQHLH